MKHVVVVGAGIGGLTSAALLARRGVAVTVLERDRHAGGKLRVEEVGGRFVDAGPTVLTMPEVFEEIFAQAGGRLADHVVLTPLEVLARHRWPDGSNLDLFADTERTVDAVSAFAGAREGRAYREFARYTERLHQLVSGPFLSSQRPTLTSVLAHAGRIGPRAMMDIDAHRTMHEAVSEYFSDPRLVQLFDRYATYCGSNPFHAPATLNVIAHVEKRGVYAVEGGMRRVAMALRALAEASGATIRLGAHVAEIVVHKGRAAGVRLEGGETLAADAVVFNGDVAALERGLLGSGAIAKSVPRTKDVSLSALTIAAVIRAEEAPLERHNVVFSSDYRAEFDAMARGRIPEEPTVYLCAQDRLGEPHAPQASERAFFIVNAPRLRDGAALEDGRQSADEESKWLKRVFEIVSRAGFGLSPLEATVTTPAKFARRFPGTNGSIYGPASVGMWSSFSRSSARSSLDGLYLAGGSVHPGAGIPMAATSGRLAAEALLEDRPSTARSLVTATLGGTWMR